MMKVHESQIKALAVQEGLQKTEGDGDHLGIQLVTSESVEEGDCGPDTCPWVDCGIPSTPDVSSGETA